MQKFLLFILLLCVVKLCISQPSANDTEVFSITVLDDKQQSAEAATVELLSANDSSLVKTALTDGKGVAVFSDIPAGNYYYKITYTGYQAKYTSLYTFPQAAQEKKALTISLLPAASTLQGIQVVGIKPFIQHSQGKVLINPDASVTNVGTTVLEVLEKSPGITVDKNGSISMQGKAGVLVMIDDKQTYLSGSELANLLSSMSSTQVEQIELIANPGAKYDASGNAGIINIKTKKNKQKGFNGSVTSAFSQGRYPKSNNSLVLNYRNGKFNTFLTYSMNNSKNFSDLYALRRYFNTNGAVIASLDQFTLFTGSVFNNTIKTGIDYSISSATTVGISLTGVQSERSGASKASATWLNTAGGIDSAIDTKSSSANSFRNGAANVYLKHVINKSQEISIDVDALDYKISSQQNFNNTLLASGGYSESSQGNIPSAIQIVSGKADHTIRFGKNGKVESGWKSSHISTDNLADYEMHDGMQWKPDYGKSNHFLYKENIHAAYSSVETKHKRFTMQAGLRYEYTAYKANQLGNILRKDSAFARNYDGLFPSGYLTWEADSSSSFAFTAGRRIDRPAFQKLNPFVFIINKYTHQTGNPYFLPQYSWNMTLSHQYKEKFTTAVSYSIIKNYFSQLFLTDSSDILIYSEGNVGRAYNAGVSFTAQVSPCKWWSFTGQANFNHKELKGFAGKNYSTSVNQLNISMNNQLRIGKIYTAELSGYYITRARNDLQELLYPTGQLSAGVSRPVLKKKGTFKMSARDIFFTQVMEGLTQFQTADEYFIFRRDSRVFNISFTYRFGKPLKTIKRNNGGAGDEMERVGSGG